MKKLLMGILALTLALSFTACGEDSKKDDKKEETKQTEVAKDSKKDEKADPKDAAEDAVKGYMDALCKFDFAEMEKYLNGELPEELSSLNLDDLKDEMMGTMPEDMEFMKSYLEDMFDTAIDKMLSTISYKITSSEEDGDDIKVTLEVTSPDFNELGTIIEEAMSSPEAEQNMMELLTEAMESGDLSEDATEQELMDYIMPKVFDIVNDIISDEISNVSKTTETQELIVSEVDGEWLINTDK